MIRNLLMAFLSVFFASCFEIAFAGYVVKVTGAEAVGDCYADGTPVLDGERYAIVWCNWDVYSEELPTFNIDGTPTDPDNCEILAIGNAIHGKCPEFSVQIGRDDYEKYSFGCSLYVFDTRVWKDGNLVVDGGLSPLNSYSWVMDLELQSNDTAVIPQPETYTGPVKVTEPSVLPDTIPVPQFSWVSMTNGIATVSVTNTATYLGYGLSMTNDMVKINSTTNFVMDKYGKPLFKQGVGAEPLVWYVDVSACQQGFFKIIRKSVLSD